MRIYTTFDNKPKHLLKPIEIVILLTIKGILTEYYQDSTLSEKNPLETVAIDVEPIKESQGRLTCYKINPSPKGLYNDVQRLYKEFIPTMQRAQGGWNEKTRETVIIIQPFDLRLRHFSGLQLEG